MFLQRRGKAKASLCNADVVSNDLIVQLQLIHAAGVFMCGVLEGKDQFNLTLNSIYSKLYFLH